MVQQCWRDVTQFSKEKKNYHSYREPFPATKKTVHDPLSVLKFFSQGQLQYCTFNIHNKHGHETSAKSINTMVEEVHLVSRDE